MEKLAPIEAAFVNDKGESETGTFEADQYGQAQLDKPAKKAASSETTAAKSKAKGK